jgi:hypothetical protein
MPTLSDIDVSWDEAADWAEVRAGWLALLKRPDDGTFCPSRTMPRLPHPARTLIIAGAAFSGGNRPSAVVLPAVAFMSAPALGVALRGCGAAVGGSFPYREKDQRSGCSMSGG